MSIMYILKPYLQFARTAPVTKPCARVGPRTVSTVNLSRDAVRNLATCAKVLLIFFDVQRITLNITKRIIAACSN